MKKWIPASYKYPLWWLFKSPPRKLGWYTLIHDIKGILYQIQTKLNPPKAGPSLSICVGLYNRSQIFKEHFIPSLLQLQYPEYIELSVFDCGSNDASDLYLYLQQHWKGKLVFTTEPHAFARSMAFNRAVAQSHGERIILCDADFSFPADLYNKVLRYTGNNIFWFPVVFYLYKNKPAVYSKRNGEWMLWGGKGILACTREDYMRSRQLNESFTEWGGEDEEYWLRVHAMRAIVIRTREKDFMHHWHPSLNPKYKLLEKMADEGKL